MLDSEATSCMIMDMGTLHITEAELARDLHTVLAKVREGVEVIVEQDHHPIALIRAPLPKGRLLSESRLAGESACPTLLPKGRLLSESIAMAEARGTAAIPDEGFMRDVEQGIAERSKPWDPPTWG